MLADDGSVSQTHLNERLTDGTTFARVDDAEQFQKADKAGRVITPIRLPALPSRSQAAISAARS
jgi:hypothetical protein